jgi:3-phenylpropionate/trans-cinnamate dioxygenase ferredoxin component
MSETESPQGERAQSETESPQGERGAMRAGRSELARAGLSEERAQSETWSLPEGSVSSGWTELCSLADVPEGTAVRIETDREPVCVVHTEGEVFAIRDVCSHAEVPLSEGELEGTTVECWLHGSRFDLRTGKPTGLPATEPVPVYATTVENGTVLARLES